MDYAPPGGRELALMIGSILYGLNLVTVWLSLERLFRERSNWKRSRDINLPMTAVVILLFMASTTYLALQVALEMRDLSQSRPEDSRMERSRIMVAQALLLVLETIIADSVLLFRCWVIWNKTFLVILLPLVLWVGWGKFYAAIAAFWTCTIIVNVYCTGSIVGRICSVQQGWRPPSICSLQDLPQRDRMQLAKRIVVESAMMYTVSSLSAFISLICPVSVAIDITCLAEAQIIGIAFNLILIRPWSQNQDHESELYVRGEKPKTNRAMVSVAIGTTDSLVDDIP
ncbi:hypothetical protein Agabi119p4_9571 [Agaricus bisporus var. burnettii]|uniref:Uncharacterized protein n=1 Tax=Agaricus bisporus var. burnettii TaxID=192524 RepID=A0A8H7C2N8_AGABI|nr:hypothetical protein Agabi119p4_9571 [Agaricus bisporus var. burnettii]